MQLKNIIFEHPDFGCCKADISIENKSIKQIKIIEIAPSDFEDVEFYVTPGFVNSHLHPNQLFDRRLLDELTISELLHRMHDPYQKTEEDRYVQSLFVLMETIKSGVTSIYSVASHPLPVIKAYKDLGLKGAITCFYNDRWEGAGDAPQLSYYELIEKDFLFLYERKTSNINIHIGSSSIESASNDLLLLINDLALQLQTKVNIHISEGRSCVESCLKSRGTTPVRLLRQLGVLSHHWNLIHASFIDSEEVAYIGEAQAAVIHCPVSNAKTGVGIAPILALQEAGAVIGLGTDACSNNNTNNILNEAYFCSLLHSATSHNPQCVNEKMLHQWMTGNGYGILGVQQSGRIEIGQPADLLLWSLEANAFVPLPYGNFSSALIYNAPDIKPHTVMIDGKVVVENYEFKILPEEKLRQAVNESSSKIASEKRRLYQCK